MKATRDFRKSGKDIYADDGNHKKFQPKSANEKKSKKHFYQQEIEEDDDDLDIDLDYKKRESIEDYFDDDVENEEEAVDN